MHTEPEMFIFDMVLKSIGIFVEVSPLCLSLCCSQWFIVQTEKHLWDHKMQLNFLKGVKSDHLLLPTHGASMYTNKIYI